MTTDANGFNSFIHVLTFYEEINEAEIFSNDFDIGAEILRRQHIKKKQQTIKNKISANLNNIRDGSIGAVDRRIVNNNVEEDGDIFKKNEKKVRRMLEHRKQTRCLNVCDLEILRANNDKDAKEEAATPK